ncbi:MAG: LuxR C-terminal-related transcriptional regulator [Alteraurantiacibacter sp.]
MQVDDDEYSRRLEVIGACTEIVPLRQAMMDALTLFGVTQAYFLAPLTRDPRVGRIVTNWGLPWVWERQYRERLHLIDPLPDLAVERPEPVVWPDDLADVKLSARQKRYLEIAAQYGLGRGVGAACFGPDGRSGFLGAILPSGARRPKDMSLRRIQTVGQVTFRVYCNIVRSSLDVPKLSNRELEVLYWIGRGKSNSVIAEILAISPSSVDVYVRRIFAKLGVTDRTTASVKAISHGLLVSGDYERFIAEQRRQQYGEE